MAKLKLRLHPLFFLFGIYYAMKGEIFVFLCFTVTALVHELGHSFTAERLGYRLNKITLMPYGAVVSGNIKDLNYKDEIAVALSGPITNLCVAITFISLWWVAPEIYPWTDIAVTANLTIAAINFLPAFPLDGGRILLALLSLKLSRNTAETICKSLGIVFSLVPLALFVVSCFYKINFSMLFFFGFMLFGALTRKRENEYVKIFTSGGKQTLKRGIEYKRVAVSEDAELKSLLRKLDFNSLNELLVYSKDGEYKHSVKPERLKRIMAVSSIYDTLETAEKKERQLTEKQQ